MCEYVCVIAISTPLFLRLQVSMLNCLGIFLELKVDQSPMSRCLGHHQIVISVYYSHIKLIRRSVYNLGQPHDCIYDDKCKRDVIFSCFFGYSHSAMVERMSFYQFFRMPTVKSQFDASLFSIKLNKKWV